MANTASNPIAVEVLRNDRVESVHRGSVAVSDSKGIVRLECGNIKSPIFPHSALKPIQALPLLETGAANAFAIGDAELALACGSHWSLSEIIGRTMAQSGTHPSGVHNNCSGKHVGMLTTARHLGLEIAGYEGASYPIRGSATRSQRRPSTTWVTRAWQSMAGRFLLMLSRLPASPALFPSYRTYMTARMFAARHANGFFRP